MEEKKCSVCDSRSNLVRHHLSYDPENLVLLCRRHHFAIHYYASVSPGGRLLFVEWVDKYGHLWVGGDKKYRHSKWGKENYNKTRRKRRWKNPKKFDEASAEWARLHLEQTRKKSRRHYKKLKEDPVRYRKYLDRVAKHQREKRKQNAVTC